MAIFERQYAKLLAMRYFLVVDQYRPDGVTLTSGSCDGLRDSEQFLLASARLRTFGAEIFVGLFCCRTG